jgi:hypothetical protein
MIKNIELKTFLGTSTVIIKDKKNKIKSIERNFFNKDGTINKSYKYMLQENGTYKEVGDNITDKEKRDRIASLIKKERGKKI